VYHGTTRNLDQYRLSSFFPQMFSDKLDRKNFWLECNTTHFDDRVHQLIANLAVDLITRLVHVHMYIECNAASMITLFLLHLSLSLIYYKYFYSEKNFIYLHSLTKDKINKPIKDSTKSITSARKMEDSLGFSS
jgi:hypothetical protein